MSRWLEFNTRVLPLLLVFAILVLGTTGGCGPPRGTKLARSNTTDLITIPATAEDRGVDEERGRVILLAAAREYSALRSYVGTIKLTYDYQGPSGNWHESRRAKLYYRAPGDLRMEHNDSNDDRYVIVANGRTNKCTSWSVGAAGTESSGSVEDILQEHAGISLHVSLLLPGFLLGTVWHAESFFVPDGQFLPAFATKARYLGEVKVNGVLCHKVTCERQIGNWTFYVGADDGLIHRIENSESEAQMVTQRDLGGGGTSGEIGRSLTVQDFEIEAINGELDNELFQPAPPARSLK